MVIILAQKLTKFRVRKVSIVNWGANDEPFTDPIKKSAADADSVVIFKSANPGDNSMPDPTKLKKEEPSETEEEKKKKEEEEAAAKAEKSAALKKEAEALAGKETEEEEKKEEEKKEEATKSADIIALIQKEAGKIVAPILEENANLRKKVGDLTAIHEIREYIQKAADTLPNLGNPAEIGGLLLSIEKSNLSKDDKARLGSILATANESSGYLFKSQGYSGRVDTAATDGTLAGEFYRLANERAGVIQKSADAPKDQKIVKALAEAAISRERPDLARAVIQAEQAATMRAQMGVV